MSNRRRYYDSNRDRNCYQNSHVNYSQMNSIDWSCENLMNHTGPSNNSCNPSFSQNSVTFYSNDPGVYNGETSNSSNPRLYSSGAVGAQAPLFNIEISSEVWARAENSQLTPTAGEFIPSSYVYQTSNSQPTQSTDTHNKYSQRSYYNEAPKNDETSLKPIQPDDIVENNVSSTSYYQRRSFDRSRGRNTNNTNNRRQFNIEQSKAEGRKKLLQEAAGLALATSDSITPKVAPRSNESANRRSQVFPGKVYQNGCRAGDSKFSSKQQDSNHQQKYSSPRKSQSGTSPRRNNYYHSNSKDSEDAVSQRERLTDQLNRGTLECLVCCEMVRQADHTWSCHNCYHVLHLRCIIKWANTSKAENGWRCPACQNVTALTPKDYLCFCNKMIGPDWNRSDTAHSCGDVCGRSKMLASEHYNCVHRCTLLCHPGPCPPCTALVTRQCGCGRSSSRVQCGQVAPLVCGAECGRQLSCGRHQCTQVCHLGACQPCQQFIKQVCQCGKESREVACDGSHSEEEQFDCGVPCEGRLSCGVHPCDRSCHSPPCGACPRDPYAVTHCPCTKTLLTDDQRRLSCQDPVPTCGQICGRQLSCGQPSNPHQCKTMCHEGPCPPCEQSTMVRCRCGVMDRELPCIELTTKADDARCQKKCTKKRMCGKHKCNQLCCIDMDHVCPLPCNHMLSCGRHRCEQLCHRGHCQPCLQSSFEELYCECGNSVLMPPVACGTKPPPCDRPCSRHHACDHEVLHNCHSFPECPPCGILTAKYCYGKHELRKAVPCHMKEFSCGLPCGRALTCGRHKCVQPCHNGPCAVLCRQPCTQPRDLCGHPCNAPCHDGVCVDSPCKESVVVTCECGHRSTSRPCFENNNEYQRIATSLLASKMADVQLGRSVNISDMQGARKITIKTLECNEECRVIERNRRLAIGLQIRNPDLSAKLTPRYSDFMRGWAKKDKRFCQHVHDKLTELVKLSKESKQKSRSYSFETMNRDKRQFVHEYCTHFGCESMAYDAEPKRNVVATAQRDKAWLPSYSLLEVVQREMGLRKVPLPNLNSASQKPASHSSVLPVRMALSQTVKPVTSVSTSSNAASASKNATVSDIATPDIDYFDYNG